MQHTTFDCFKAALADIPKTQNMGRVTRIENNMLYASGLNSIARVGDRVAISGSEKATILGEVLQIHAQESLILPDIPPMGTALQAPVLHMGAHFLAPSSHWVGRIIDPDGCPLDGKPLLRGAEKKPLFAAPPAAAKRKPLGQRLETGLAAFNTLLPIVRGQRVGLFAGSGVGKSNILGHLAQNVQADVVVLALIGERGRELGAFVSEILGEEGMKRCVIVAATSDQSPLMRRRCANSAMTIAEFFRDQGKQVLYLADSITRFAEAHREVASAAGEPPVLRGYPASTSHAIMSLCERAGPGLNGSGDITAVFSVLVAGSDMEEPIADILRGVLDGHIVLDRNIAERGRYPAIDLLRSVSRSLPKAASGPENALISHARRLLGSYERSEMMVRAGLYAEGSDPDLDTAIRAWPDLDMFLALSENGTTADSFKKLELILRRVAHPATPQQTQKA